MVGRLSFEREDRKRLQKRKRKIKASMKMVTKHLRKTEGYLIK